MNLLFFYKAAHPRVCISLYFYGNIQVTLISRPSAGEVPVIVETKVHCEEPSRARALTARAAYTVWFTAHESTYSLAHSAAKVMEKVKKCLGNASS